MNKRIVYSAFTILFTSPSLINDSCHGQHNLTPEHNSHSNKKILLRAPKERTKKKQKRFTKREHFFENDDNEQTVTKLT